MRVAAAVVLGSLAFANVAVADDDDPVYALEVHGFVSQGGLLSSDNNFLANSSRGSLEFTEVGLNVSKQLDDRLRIGMQLFAHDLGPVGDYKPKFDWFNLDYHWRDWLGLRAGRVKVPYGLYNDTSDIDAAHAVALLPQSIYAAGNRDALLAQTGLELYGFANLEGAGNLEYRAFGGTIFIDPNESATATTTNQTIDVPYVTGARVAWETPLDGLRVAATAMAARLTTELVTPGDPVPITAAFDLKMGVGSIEYVRDALQLTVEVARWWATYTTSLPDFPAGKQVDARGYAQASYRFAPWFQLSSYYSMYYPDFDHRSGRASHQFDAALSLRFDISPHWIVKLEGHDMRGTAGLSPALNGGTMPAMLDERWVLAVAKTTVYF